MTHYDLTHKIYSENIIEINDKIKLSKFPITFKVLINFSLKINDILKCLKNAEENECFYSSQGLTRILYEHYLIAFYIWTKCRTNNNDECALDYHDYYPIFELIKQNNYNSKLDKSYDNTKTPLQNFLLKYPKIANSKVPFTEESLLDINVRSNKFDIRKILKFMVEN